MDFGTIVGFIIGVISIFGIACKWDFLSYFDVPSLGLVFGGCVTSILISVPLSRIKTMPGIFMRSFKETAEESPENLIARLVQYGEIARKDGILALEGILDTIPNPFLRQGLQLAVDGTDPDVIREMLDTKVENIERRHEERRRGWEICRGAAPGWGAMGTVVGLVQMVKGGVEDPNALIMGIAVALLTTFYGSLISSWLVGPVCDKLAEKTADEVLAKSIITRGIMSLQAGDNPRLMKQKLEAFLSDKNKKGD